MMLCFSSGSRIMHGYDSGLPSLDMPWKPRLRALDGLASVEPSNSTKSYFADPSVWLGWKNEAVMRQGFKLADAAVGGEEIKTNLSMKL